MTISLLSYIYLLCVIISTLLFLLIYINFKRTKRTRRSRRRKRKSVDLNSYKFSHTNLHTIDKYNQAILLYASSLRNNDFLTAITLALFTLQDKSLLDGATRAMNDFMNARRAYTNVSRVSAPDTTYIRNVYDTGLNDIYIREPDEVIPDADMLDFYNINNAIFIINNSVSTTDIILDLILRTINEILTQIPIQTKIGSNLLELSKDSVHRHVNYTQQVHDTNVSSAVKYNIDKLRLLNGNKAVVNELELSEFLSERGFSQRLSSSQPVKLAILLVWNRCHSVENRLRAFLMRKAFRQSIFDCELNNLLVCNTGIITKVISSLGGLDADLSLGILLNKDMIRSAIYSHVGDLQTKIEDLDRLKELIDIYLLTYNKTFNLKLIKLIRDIIHAAL